MNSQPTYTQGPWNISTDPDEPEVIAELCTSGLARFLIVPTGENALGDIEADARVVAAAPDLLRACIALVNWCDKNPPAGEALYFVAMAREAIAKALTPNDQGQRTERSAAK
jgi:hypothetical protein